MFALHLGTYIKITLFELVVPIQLIVGRSLHMINERRKKL